MRKQDFRFDLPEALIANEPSENRTQSRLMLLNPENQTVNHRRFYELIDFIEPNDCLIFNNTKVIPARLRGTRDSGGTVEILVERVVPGESEDTCIAQVKASNSPKPGTKIHISADFSLEVLGRDGAFYRLKSLSKHPLFTMIETYGSMPLPPYIKRTAEEVDKQRYQTVFAAKQGAVAAPTAGLHFDQQLMDKLRAQGIATDFVTLHVGASTFSPVRVDNILEHQMHSEWFEVPESVVALVKKTRKAGGRVIAVGTTSVRCLESASVSGAIQASRGETDIFIYPGYQFKSVDALITNFHLSESTLLMLVSAFAGREFILQSYQQAVTEQYRFFSYGDAMFIQNRIN